MTFRLVLLAASLFLLTAADNPSPISIPTLDQLVNASPAVLLAIGFIGFLRGVIVQGYLYTKSEARAEAATAAAVLSNKTAADAIAAVAKLSDDHQKEITKLSEDHSREMTELQAQLARFMPTRRGA